MAPSSAPPSVLTAPTSPRQAKMGPRASGTQLQADAWLELTLVRTTLVARFSQIDGYRCLSLMRASGVVKCQLALA